jgi:hypothetical protein
MTGRESGRMKLFGLNWYRRYAVAFLAVVIVFVVANAFNFLRRVTCWDCFFPYGVPLTLYQEGGEGGGGGVVWRGLVADVAIVIFASALLGWVWTILAGQHSKPPSRS